MKILLIGGGGREHAIAEYVAKSPLCDELLCAPGNAGIAGVARCYADIKATNIDGVIALARAEAVDFIIVAPDDPLALGMVDALNEAGFMAFGPVRAAAKIEWSKAYAKALMERKGVPTARYRAFEDYDAACAYVRGQAMPLYIKADGLALGKGAVRADSVDEALNILKDMMVDKAFGAAAASVDIEECMEGPGVTQLCFVDGEHIALMPSSRDHKRALDGDMGLNTGGMGAIAPCPDYDADMAARVLDTIIKPVIEGLREDGAVFKGVLYAGLMMTKDGPKVIEFNARFGDPETQAVLPLLKSDLVKVMMDCADGTLDADNVRWSNDKSACVVVASGGYPEGYQTGYAVSGLNDAPGDVMVFHAGTRLDDGVVVTSGGRVLGVTALGTTLSEALDKAYGAIDGITFTGAYARRDIGAKERSM